jgi:hypothetical protein
MRGSEESREPNYYLCREDPKAGGESALPLYYIYLVEIMGSAKLFYSCGSFSWMIAGSSKGS